MSYLASLLTRLSCLQSDPVPDHILCRPDRFHPPKENERGVFAGHSLDYAPGLNSEVRDSDSRTCAGVCIDNIRQGLLLVRRILRHIIARAGIPDDCGSAGAVKGRP